MTHSVAGGFIGLLVTINGVAADSGTGGLYGMQTHVIGGDVVLAFQWETTPAAGSQVIRPQFSTNAATASVLARATLPLIFTVEEIVRPNADNS